MSFMWRTRDAMIRQLRSVEAVVIDWDDSPGHARSPGGGDPSDRLSLMSTAQQVTRLKDAGMPVAIVGRGIRPADADAPADRAPVVLHSSQPPRHADAWRHHRPPGGPAADSSPALLLGGGSGAFDFVADRVAVIADTVTAMRAAQAEGSVGILAPSQRTTSWECALVPLTVGTLGDAVDLVLGAYSERVR